MVTTGVEQHDQGVVAGVYGTSQQLGGAVGLAVLAGIAASGGTLGAAGELVRSVAEQAHAIRMAFVISAALAFGTVIVVFLTLPRRLDDADVQATAHDLAHDLALSPMPGEMTAFDT
jgi:MFS family permease